MANGSENPFDAENVPEILVLGIGSLLFSDDGFGIHVVRRLEAEYTFPDRVHVVDGGVLGVNLLGVISKPRHLIVVDAVRNRGRPGDLHRIDHEEIPARIRAKNSLHQVDFLEALTLCQALDSVPRTVILGVEPLDVETLGLTLSPPVAAQVEPVIRLVLEELERLGVHGSRKDSSADVSGDPFAHR